MPELLQLAGAFRQLVEFIDGSAVPQGQYFVVRGAALRELEQRAACVAAAATGAGLPPDPDQNPEPGHVVHQACQEALRLQRAARDASSCCIDVRLGVSPVDVRGLFEQAAHQAAEVRVHDKPAAARERTGTRHARPKPELLKRSQATPSRLRQVPKHIEMMGKAAKLLDLIQSELQDRAGRTITHMCQTVGISRETFQESRHFEQARRAWAGLKESRRAQAAQRP